MCVCHWGISLTGLSKTNPAASTGHAFPCPPCSARTPASLAHRRAGGGGPSSTPACPLLFLSTSLISARAGAANPKPIPGSRSHPPKHGFALPFAAWLSLTGMPARAAAVPRQYPSLFVLVSAGPSITTGATSLECAVLSVQLQVCCSQPVAACAASRHTRVHTFCFVRSGLNSCHKPGDSLHVPAALSQLNPPEHKQKIK